MAITTTNSMLVAYRSVLWRFAVVVIVSQIVIRRSVNYFFSYQVSKNPILITYPNFDFVAHLSNFVCQVGQNPKIEVSYQVTKSEI